MVVGSVFARVALITAMSAIGNNRLKSERQSRWQRALAKCSNVTKSVKNVSLSRRNKKATPAALMATEAVSDKSCENATQQARFVSN